LWSIRSGANTSSAPATSRVSYSSNSRKGDPQRAGSGRPDHLA
jgi:hypothetical protein